MLCAVVAMADYANGGRITRDFFLWLLHGQRLDLPDLVRILTDCTVCKKNDECVKPGYGKVNLSQYCEVVSGVHGHSSKQSRGDKYQSYAYIDLVRLQLS